MTADNWHKWPRTGKIANELDSSATLKDDKFQDIADTYCRKYKQCDPTKNTAEICGYFANNGSTIKLSSVCELFRLNCQQQTLLWKTSNDKCKNYFRTDSWASDVEKLKDENLQKDFVFHACESYKSCFVNTSLAVTEICTLDLENGGHVRFKNLCLMHKYNCNILGSYFRIGDGNCVTTDKLHLA